MQGICLPSILYSTPRWMNETISGPRNRASATFTVFPGDPENQISDISDLPHKRYLAALCPSFEVLGMNSYQQACSLWTLCFCVPLTGRLDFLRHCNLNEHLEVPSRGAQTDLEVCRDTGKPWKGNDMWSFISHFTVISMGLR